MVTPDHKHWRAQIWLTNGRKYLIGLSKKLRYGELRAENSWNINELDRLRKKKSRVDILISSAMVATYSLEAKNDWLAGLSKEKELGERSETAS